MQVCTENCDTAAITSPGIGVASDGVLRFTIPVQAGRPALDLEHPPNKMVKTVRRLEIRGNNLSTSAHNQKLRTTTGAG